MGWTESRIAVDGWDSETGDYRIIRAKNGKYRLVSFIHDGEDGDLWFKDFPTLDAAKEYAEFI
jgi:hypothetical protein